MVNQRTMEFICDQMNLPYTQENDLIIVPFEAAGKVEELHCVTNFSLTVPAVLGIDFMTRFGFKLSATTISARDRITPRVNQNRDFRNHRNSTRNYTRNRVESHSNSRIARRPQRQDDLTMENLRLFEITEPRRMSVIEDDLISFGSCY